MSSAITSVRGVTLSAAPLRCAHVAQSRCQACNRLLPRVMGRTLCEIQAHRWWNALAEESQHTR
jgi:hypothetical protein